MKDSKPRILAFYLPQYHPFKENDEWWGKGFTEWTNVGKARPLFKGHYQPRVPADLGYYDLRLPIVRQQQADLAREAGVEAFCYWHYWFGNGRRLIPEVFDEVLASGKPDFPFCLAWANHSWFAKNWNADGTTTEKMLMEQTYPGEEDARQHFDFLLKAFNDKRYVRVDGKPLLFIFDPIKLPRLYLDLFRKWAKEAGLPGLYIIANVTSLQRTAQEILDLGYDAISYQRLGSMTRAGNKTTDKVMRRLDIIAQKVKGILRRRPPFMEDYGKVYTSLVTDEERDERVIPVLLPQWDHTPRSGWNGKLLVNSTPENFAKHARQVLDTVKGKNNKLIFLKSWNEWGEGNYMEPDLRYGRGFIDALANELKKE